MCFNCFNEVFKDFSKCDKGQFKNCDKVFDAFTFMQKIIKVLGGKTIDDLHDFNLEDELDSAVENFHDVIH